MIALALAARENRDLAGLVLFGGFGFVVLAGCFGWSLISDTPDIDDLETLSEDDKDEP